MLLPSLRAFFDFQQAASFSIVLDSENAADHALGDELRTDAAAAGLPVRVAFADPPPAAVLGASPYKAEHGRIAGPGYTRQLYDTFWFDTFLPAGADLDTAIVGVMDADSPFIAVAALQLLLDGGAIVHVARPGGSWPGDSHMLGERCEFDTMGPGAMPQLFHAATFRRAREHIAAAHGAPSFEAAWLQLYGQPARPAVDRNLEISPANVLLNFAASHEAGYRLASIHDRDAAVPVLAHNKGRPARAVLGCCRAFSLPLASCPPAAAPADFAHITAVDGVTWADASRAAAADRAYAVIHDVLRSVPPARYAQMRAACEGVANWTRTWTEIASP